MKPFYFSSLCFEELEHDLDSFRQLPAALEASTEIVGLEIACHKYAQILCQACPQACPSPDGAGCAVRRAIRGWGRGGLGEETRLSVWPHSVMGPGPGSEGVL